MVNIKHLEKSKWWCAVLVVIFAISWFEDARISLTEDKWDSWVYRDGARFKQAGLEVVNRSKEQGIWISARDAHLQERGLPNWWANGLMAICVSQILWHLYRLRRTSQPDGRSPDTAP